jgi:hypothetical protein
VVVAFWPVDHKNHTRLGRIVTAPSPHRRGRVEAYVLKPRERRAAVFRTVMDALQKNLCIIIA